MNFGSRNTMFPGMIAKWKNKRAHKVMGKMTEKKKKKKKRQQRRRRSRSKKRRR